MDDKEKRRDDYPAHLPDSPEWLKKGAITKYDDGKSRPYKARIVDNHNANGCLTIKNFHNTSWQDMLAHPEELWPWGELTRTIYKRDTADSRIEIIFVSQGSAAKTVDG
ncbi:MAG: hypothetical protein WC455_11770 [Dehalococcoidia bacterium]|jgi:hypothetical protein